MKAWPGRKALRSIQILLPGLLSIGLAQPTNAVEAPSFDWSGPYVGGHVAYGRGHIDGTLFDPNPVQFSRAFGSLYGGLQIGYSYVLPSRLLLGAEADVSFPNFLEDGLISSRTTAQGTNVTDQIDYIATLRGRVGYTFDHWLIYATSGLAWSQARFTESPAFGSDADKTRSTRSGWTAGMGVELAVASN
jgi:high affinity Mn2+ porin